MGRDITVPALVVNMVESLALSAAYFASTYLIVFALILLAIIRLMTKK
jgi:ABC-type sulfate transport system permease component